MSYAFVSMEDAGTGTGDFAMRLRRKPSALRRWFGAQKEDFAYYGQDAKWHAMDGSAVRSRLRAVIEKLWHQKQQDAGADSESSEIAEPTARHIRSAYCDLVEVASEDSFPASDPPAWTLGRQPHPRPIAAAEEDRSTEREGCAPPLSVRRPALQSHR